METVLEQTFDFAVITPFKNYCDLSEKRKSMNTFMNEIDNLDDEDDLFGSKIKRVKTNNDCTILSNVSDSVGRLIYITDKSPKKDTKFFYSGIDDISQKIQINFAYRHPKVNTTGLYTNNHETIKKHFINPFSEVLLVRLSRSIRIKGDRITIKIYKQEKNRNVFCKYYQKRSLIYSVTIDKNFNFITLSMEKTNRLNKKDFKKNSFERLKDLIFTNYGLFGKKSNYIPSYYDNLYNDFNETFNDEQFYDVLCRELGITRSDVNDRSSFFDCFLKKFVERKGIKVPNDYKDILINLYPTQKYLKKNGNKLIASILDYFGFKTKSTIKLFHSTPKIDIDFFIEICRIIGHDYSKFIANLNPKLFNLQGKIDFRTRKQKVLYNKSFYTDMNDGRIELEHIEKENLIHILNSLDDITMTDRFLGDFLDHIDMIRKIRTYDELLIIKCKTYSEFSIEHLELSKLIAAIKKGWVIEYEFNEKMVEDVETPIEVYKDKEKIMLYPYILKREEEYAEEGAFMHHCVATYAEKQSSIIISLRTEDKSDRVTSEFLTQTGNKVQSRHFCNGVPPEYFNSALEILCDKANKYARYGMLNSLSKKKVKAMINGVEIKPEFNIPPAQEVFNRLLFGEQFLI